MTDSTPGRAPRTPSGLATAGARLWRDVVTTYQLRVDELRVLESACRTLDGLSRLEEALLHADLTAKGSMGQVRENPLFSETRMQRTSLAKLLAQLNLPDEDQAAGAGGNRSTAARHAAQSRWETPWKAS